MFAACMFPHNLILHDNGFMQSIDTLSNTMNSINEALDSNRMLLAVYRKREEILSKEYSDAIALEA